jgi:hypothetical protein
MKELFWNSRGLADLAKHIFLAELVKEEQINFIALSEIGRESFPDHVLKILCAGHDFFGTLWLPMADQVGSCWGSILVCLILVLSMRGIFMSNSPLDTSQLTSSLPFILFMDRHKHKTRARLAELANTCSNENLPFLVGGDFNIMRKPEDKSCGDFDTKWPSLFNAVIASLDLREIVITGRRFTWGGCGG